MDLRGPGRVGAALGLAVVAVVGVGAGVRELDRAPALTTRDIGALPAAAATDPAGAIGGGTGSDAAAGGRVASATTDPRPRRAPARSPAKPRARPLAVPPAVPAALALPAQRIAAPVVPTGVRPDGELEIPESPRTVGWWVGSAPAGSPGPTVLAGHVDSRSAGVGALAALRDVTVGSPVVLTDVFGGRHAYRVAARRTYRKYALPRTVFAAAPLVLITCGGPFDEHAGRYRDNIVVYAAPA